MTLVFPRVEARVAGSEKTISIYHFDPATGEVAKDLPKGDSARVADVAWLQRQVNFLQGAGFTSSEHSIPLTNPHSKIRGYQGGGVVVVKRRGGDAGLLATQRTDAPFDPWMPDGFFGMSGYPFDDKDGWAHLMVKELCGEGVAYRGNKLCLPKFKKGFGGMTAEQLSAYAQKVIVNETETVGMDFDKKDFQILSAEIVEPKGAALIKIFGSYKDVLSPPHGGAPYATVDESFRAGWISNPEHATLETAVFLYLSDVPEDVRFRDTEKIIKDKQTVDLQRTLLEIRAAKPKEADGKQIITYRLNGEPQNHSYESYAAVLGIPVQPTLKLAAMAGRYWRDDVFGHNDGLEPLYRQRSRVSRPA